MPYFNCQPSVQAPHSIGIMSPVRGAVKDHGYKPIFITLHYTKRTSWARTGESDEDVRGQSDNEMSRTALWSVLVEDGLRHNNAATDRLKLLRNNPHRIWFRIIRSTETKSGTESYLGSVWGAKDYFVICVRVNIRQNQCWHRWGVLCCSVVERAVHTSPDCKDTIP